MSVPEKLKSKYSLAGDTYSAKDADRAISDLYACVNRLYADIGTMRERATKAEEQASRLTLENQDLTAENEKLNAEVSKLTDSNRRIANEAQELDRKLANVSVNASANDRKLTETADKLASLLERTEALCSLIDGKASKLCIDLENSSNRFDEAVKALQKAADARQIPVASEPEATKEEALDNAVENVADVNNAESSVAVSDKPSEDAVFAFKIYEPLSADEDTQTAKNTESDVIKAPEFQSETNENALIEETKENNDNTEKAEAVETAVNAVSNEAVEANELSDDDIKNMLSAMYSTEGTASVAEENTPTPEEEAATTSENSEKFGSMKNSLDAIRRRLGK